MSFSCCQCPQSLSKHWAGGEGGRAHSRCACPQGRCGHSGCGRALQLGSWRRWGAGPASPGRGALLLPLPTEQGGAEGAGGGVPPALWMAPLGPWLLALFRLRLAFPVLLDLPRFALSWRQEETDKAAFAKNT